MKSKKVSPEKALQDSAKALHEARKSGNKELVKHFERSHEQATASFKRLSK